MCTDRSNGKWVLTRIIAVGVQVNHYVYRQVKWKVGTHPDYSTGCSGKSLCVQTDQMESGYSSGLQHWVFM